MNIIIIIPFEHVCSHLILILFFFFGLFLFLPQQKLWVTSYSSLSDQLLRLSHGCFLAQQQLHEEPMMFAHCNTPAVTMMHR